MAIFRRGPPVTGASNAGGGGGRDTGPVAGYRSMTAAVRTTSATMDGAVYRTERYA